MSAKLHLLKQLTIRSVQQRFRGSILGWGWIVGQPLLMMAAYTIVFGLIFGGRYEGQPDESAAIYALGIFLSLGLYNFFSEILQSAPQMILSNTVYVKKVAFPLEMLPLSSMGAPVITLLIQLFLVLVGAAVTGFFHITGILYVFVSILILLGFGIGVAFWFSALGVFIRDIQQISGVLGLVLLYASGVFYSTQTVKLHEPVIWSVLRFNPLVHLVDSSRSALLFGQSVDFAGLIYAAVLSLLTAISGIMFFRWIKSSFADVM